MVSGDTAAVLVDSRENYQKLAAFAAAYMPALRAKLEHYTGERPLFDLYNVEPEIEKALARRVEPEVGRHAGHRPDRGDDHHRRQYRRLRRPAQFRRHRVQDQPGGGAGDRAPAAPAQPRRHHRRRFHRHGIRGAPRRGAGGVQARARARPHAHDGERLHRARAGGDDAQAHARIARARAVRALRRLRRARRGEDRAHRVLRGAARGPARGARLQRARVPRARLAAGAATCSRKRNRARWRCSRISSANRSRCRSRLAICRSNTISCLL